MKVVQLKKSSVRNRKEAQPSLIDELKTQVSNRRRLIHPSSGLFEENNFDDDDSKSGRSPTSQLQGGQLKYKYKARDRKSVKERAENWLPILANQ